MKIYRYILILTFVTAFITGCEKVIPVKLDEGTSQLTVDAFLDDDAATQTIRLTKTGAYFANVPNAAATGATVNVMDNEGHNYNFVDNTNSGNYTWTPSAGDTLVRVFNSYTLTVVYGGEQFTATSVAFPSPLVDSVVYESKINPTGKASTTAYTASFYANDIPEMTNFYWIKSYKNGVYYAKPGQVNLSQDGSFAGGGTDGLTFIFPIRTAIVPGNDSLISMDSVTVKICAINPDTYFFLGDMVTQTNNGGLFATPPSNVGTNIKNVNPNSSTKAVGWFNIGQVTKGGVRVK